MLHRLFNTTKSKRMESKSTPSTPTRPKPKLDRRNAAKNINYEDESFAIRTRSIDVYPWGDRTSFRINGDDGEMEFLCTTLGISGPDDLGINSHDYEAMKAKSLGSSYNLRWDDVEDVNNDSVVEDVGVSVGRVGVVIRGERPAAVKIDVDEGGESTSEDDGVLRRDSSSFTTYSNDDDSSSTTTDPMSISPTPTLRRQISSWSKGSHLGSGSYGSVYEGIAE